MTQSNRGAAQVSLMWAIALLVVALVSVFLAYSTTSKLTVAESNYAASQVDLSAEINKFIAKTEEIATVSKVVGWQPEGDSTALPVVQAVQNSIAELGTVFPAVNPNSGSLEGTLPGAISDFKAAQTRIADLESEVAQLRADLNASQSEGDTTISEKEATIASLESTAADERTSANESLVAAERQRDALRDQYRELDERLAQTIAEKDAEIQQIRSGSSYLKQRNDILSDRLNGVTRRAEMADGSVLTANAKLAKAWIDLGRRDRVNRGLQFEVLDKTSGDVKARLQITAIEDRRSECEILMVSDRYNPVGQGDIIRNAVFDRSHQPVAVLLGSSFGRYSASDMVSKLAEVGISVVEDVGVEVDYLLLGTPFFDEDTGEMVPWDQQDNYKLAQGISVEIVPRRDWLAWLGL
jgi:myosin heavy subunit